MMKKTFPILPALVLLLAGACSKNSGGGGVKLRNDTDSVAYVIGMNVGANLLKMDSTINVNAVCEGIRDMFRQSQTLGGRCRDVLSELRELRPSREGARL